MIRKNRPLKDDLIQCLYLLALGLGCYSPFLPETVENILGPILLMVLVVLLIVSMAIEQHRRDMSAEEKRDLEREGRDERSLMIQSNAAMLCYKVENWGLILLFALFILVLDMREVAYLIYWLLLFRFCLFFATRWWLNRKY